MPYKAQKECSHFGCHALTRERFCSKHKAEHTKQFNHSSDRLQERKFYDTPQWRALCKMKTSRNPHCERCESVGRIVKAEVVDHVVEIKDGGHPLDLDNLQSLCRSCHSSKTLKERQGRVYTMADVGGSSGQPKRRYIDEDGEYKF